MGTARDRLDTVVIPALSSITAQQASAIAQAVQRAGHGAWTAEITHDYDGYRSVFIESTDAKSDNTFYVSGTSSRLELFTSKGDEITNVAAFSDTEELAIEFANLVRFEDARMSMVR